MNTAFQDLLDAAKIKKIVWIDDLFNEGAHATPADISIPASVAYLHTVRSPLAHRAFEGRDPDEPLEVWQQAVEIYIAANPGDTMFLEELTKAAGEQSLHEYLPGVLDTIVGAMGERVVKLGLAAWHEKESELIGEAGDLLFLVDRQFIVDGATHNEGEGIVASLVRQCPHTPVVMLTHSVTVSTLEEERQKIALAQRISPNQFAMLEKRQSSEDSALAERELRTSLRMIFTYRTCETLSAEVAKLFSDALQGAIEDLRAQSVYDLDRVVFENSLVEGASELDVLIRVIQGRQRVRAQSGMLVARESFSAIVGRLRDIRASTGDAALPVGREGESPLNEWRRNEVYDKGEYVNAFFAPLACGDLFAKTQGGVPQFVLLEQPCDLVVRSEEGSRNASEGVLVRVVAKAPEAEAMYGVPAWTGSGEWSLDFRQWCSVRLRYLELACYNATGHIALDAEASAPAGLLPGWRRSHTKRCNEVTAAANSKEANRAAGFLMLTLSDNLKPGSGTLAGKKLSFPLYRVGRLRPPRAMTALAAFAAYRTRAAFDHDFAKGLAETPSVDVEPSDAQNTAAPNAPPRLEEV